VRPTDGIRRAAIAAMLLLGARTSAAQLPLLFEGLADAELWSTTTASNLLTRNNGRLGPLGRVQAWAAIEPVRRFVVYAQGEIETGTARTTFVDDDYHATMNQFGVRATASPALVFDVGRLLPVVGTFASRRFSNRNPLIGAPDGYTLDYPYGAMVSGTTKHFDYRAAMVSLPASHRNYVPVATHRLRPAAGVGFTPVVGVRIGGSFTVGPYLNDRLTPTQLQGQGWASYDQRVVALDARVSRGYLETHFEAARGSYDVPGRASPVWGYNYYGEAKYTFTPRLFAAGRAERNNYPFVRANATGFNARVTDFVNGEAGVGYRFAKGTLVKASVRSDRWWVAEGAQGFRGRGGTAVAMQWSQAFDVSGWFVRDQ
jgi:hypothetical protein